MKQIKINLYEVTYCGYYNRQNNKLVSGNLAYTLNDLYQWAWRNEQIKDTATYEQTETLQKTYCFNIERNTNNDYLIILWNQISEPNAKIPTISLNQDIGDTNFQSIDPGSDTIPGFPTYFWFIPSYGIMAKLQFNNSPVRKREIEYYIQNFLKKFSTQTNHSINNNQSEEYIHINGYHDSKNNSYNPSLTPIFTTRQIIKQGNIDQIKNKITEIRKIVKKEHLNIYYNSDDDIISKLFQRMGINNKVTFEAEPIPIKYELNYQPSLEDFDNIVYNFFNNNDGYTEDIGFYMRGKNSPYWLNKNIISLKENIHISSRDINNLNNNNVIIAANTILDELSKIRDRVIQNSSHRINYHEIYTEST